MRKETITYVDFDGNSQTEDFLFNLNETELLKLNGEFGGSLQNAVARIANTKDMEGMMHLIETMILRAYGEKSDDGKRFIKTRNGEPLSVWFKETEAYNVLFQKFLNDTDSAIEFFNGIVPAKLLEKAQQQTNTPQLVPVD